jgi:hypothetical protein
MDVVAKYAGMAGACVPVGEDAEVAYARGAMARGLLLGVKGVRGSERLPSIERMDEWTLRCVRRAASALRCRELRNTYREQVRDRSADVDVVRKYDGARVLALGSQGDPYVVTPSVKEMVKTTSGAVYAKPSYVDWAAELVRDAVPLTDVVRARLVERSVRIRQEARGTHRLAWMEHVLREDPRYVSLKLVDAVERAYEGCLQKVVT